MSSRWWYALAATCIAYYAFTVTQLADSTPKFDDLNDVFGFFKQLALAHTPLQKIGAFFYPNNEHITFFSHLVYLTQYRCWVNPFLSPILIWPSDYCRYRLLAGHSN
ncbi:MAG: hypothetical protein IPK95_07100 [Cellvibrionales bacterium]|nr:hypothetical protein [Cellvibrionales bacterium]